MQLHRRGLACDPSSPPQRPRQLRLPTSRRSAQRPVQWTPVPGGYESQDMARRGETKRCIRFLFAKFSVRSEDTVNPLTCAYTCAAVLTGSASPACRPAIACGHLAVHFSQASANTSAHGTSPANIALAQFNPMSTCLASHGSNTPTLHAPSQTPGDA